VYYLSVVIILSSYVTIIPNHSLQYVDVSGCPIIVTDEEANNQTILDALQQVVAAIIKVILLLHHNIFYSCV